ncbi:protease inhibitor I42 family protein [Cryobacterium sp. CG_9.6]|uniref:protease inhibitor I42 family protein n=1 Tax=Cryobacterium sp. CG_9.6 TaxID=2760710 RepID=UPI002475E465|nr:protease inhibitor I42 family protein [Cryobacterium sp. CG_9.6]
MSVAHRILDNPVSGAVVDLPVGDTLEIRLNQIGGAGYLWKVAAEPTNVRLDDDRLDHFRGGLPGAAAGRILTFQAVADGSGRLRLTLVRPWEDEPIESVEIEVNVMPE